ncbi:MAG TPA: delta-60 repeat domain-containing protein, partial [Pyrinomonadaceae bacterium]|nr:delta-60 repeat domain-containing protein [Pyrinomonadaceae bacterium]
MPDLYIFCCATVASLLIALSSPGGFLARRVESVNSPVSVKDLANAGGLDLTFNLTGEKEIPISPTGGSAASHDQVNGIAVQSDGKIVLTGYVRANINDTSSPEQIGVVRLNADGSMDTGFGNSGIVTTQAATATINPNSRGQAVAIQADGKIVVAGMANANTLLSQQDFALVRYNVNGSLDTTFGSGGKVTGTFTSSGFTTTTASASSLLIQPDGKIVAGGMALNVPTSTDFALARYNSDGSLDTTFGTGGKVTTDFGSIAEQSTGIAFLTDQG